MNGGSKIKAAKRRSEVNHIKLKDYTVYQK